MSWFDAPIIVYEKFIENRDVHIMGVAEYFGLHPSFSEENKKEVIRNPDYTKIFTNYEEIVSWFH